MIKVALAGQPNCGKSTIFTMLSGINQHVANYPGVTIDKKVGYFKAGHEKVQLVDLPGTYSFNSFSLEERVTKNYLIKESPDIIINVVDASCLKRSLPFTFELLEAGKPVILVLNMIDVAKRRGLKIDIEALSSELGIQVIATNGLKGQGKKEVTAAIINQSKCTNAQTSLKIDYPRLETVISMLASKLDESSLSGRWVSLKALGGDSDTLSLISSNKDAMKIINDFRSDANSPDVELIIATERRKLSARLYELVVNESENKKTYSDMIDKVILNRWCSFAILLFVIYVTYELSIVKGYELTNYTWPYLAKLKNFIFSMLPSPEFITTPLITEFGVWLINSAMALLNYIPIFVILFALIAIMEDIGYMPRIAFILDRIFRHYGLHGQSTLPLVLGGAFVGGCAVPGIMATKGIADERARIATALTVPYMNCLAKVPFYTLILGAFFAVDMTLVMFFISTVTIFIALSMARLLTSTFLKQKETSPFIMALPAYNFPNFKNVAFQVMQKIWLYIYKVGTIVMAVAVVLFVLLQYPGVSEKAQERINSKAMTALEHFHKQVELTPFKDELASNEAVFALLNLYNTYRSERMVASSGDIINMEKKYSEENPILFKFVKPSDSDERKINKAVRNLSKQAQLLQNEIKNERVSNSFLGIFGRAIEPVTQFAGFDWRINVAFLSSFAARESAVATIGSIYTSGQDERVEKSLENDGYYTPLHAAAMLIFMIFTPPCIASMVVVKLNVNSYKLMFLAMLMPFAIGIIIASAFFMTGMRFNWSGVEMMTYFYIFIVSLTLLLGFRRKRKLSKSQSIYVRQK